MDLKQIQMDKLRVYVATTSDENRSQLQTTLRNALELVAELQIIFANYDDADSYAPLIGKPKYDDLCSTLRNLPKQLAYFITTKPNITVFDNLFASDINEDIAKAMRTFKNITMQIQKVYAYVRYYYLF